MSEDFELFREVGRSRARLATLVVVAILMMAVGVPPAEASEATVVDLVVTYSAFEGEANVVSVEGDPTGIFITDAGPDIAAGDGCVEETAHTVFCTTDIDRLISVDLGDLDDSFLACESPCLVPSNRFDVRGGFGADSIDLGRISRPSVVDGGPDDDILRGGQGTDTVRGGDGNDVVDGGDGRSFSDTVFGDSGDDILSLRSRSGTITGGEGSDWADYTAETSDFTIRLGQFSGPTNDFQFQFIANDVENISGGAGNDTITGNALGNELIGGPGEDVIEGGDGDDTIRSDDESADMVLCGSGYDTVVADVLDEIAEDCEQVDMAAGPLLVQGDLTLDADHYGEIVVVADGITFDCADHLVSGPGAIGIKLSGRQGVTVRNCNVEGFDFGFHVDAAVGNVFDSNVATANAETAFYLTESHSNVFESNEASHTGCDGFLLNSSNGNEFRRNRITNNGCSAFGLFDSHENGFTENLAAHNQYEGFYLNGSSRNHVEASLIDSNGGSGIAVVEDSLDNTLIHNTIKDSGVEGISLHRADLNRIESNKVTGSGWGGVVLSQSTENTILDNDVRRNGDNGFVIVDGSSINHLEANSARSNIGQGFLIESGSNTLTLNLAIDNETGFAVFGPSNVLVDNLSNLNSSGGFYLGEGAKDGTVTSSRALRNGSAGFSTDPAAFANHFSDNVACQNGLQDGAEDAIDAGSNNTWESNKFCTSSGIDT